MEFRGQPPEADQPGAKRRNSEQASCSAEDELDAIFRSIATEIDERRDHLHFLLNIKKVKADAPSVRQTRSEISERERELHQVHQLIIGLGKE